MESSTSPTIVKATPSHVPFIQSIVNAAYTKYISRIGKRPAPMLADYSALIQSSTHEIYVLLEPGTSPKLSTDPDVESTILGSVVLDTSSSTELKINNLAVDPGAQGKGYGRLLMNFAEEQARETGRDALELYTGVKMIENLALYQKLGFLEFERREEDGFERVFFRKELK
ncbi:acyl-CoA N-acyltransferase [Aspergillus karnatakaensis]|uniref:GNAT family N-acetyltransferase n=1 Tax=Aspergillus karnatakaensis TaxID=1810916 RepID=UPI003CCDE5FB